MIDVARKQSVPLLKDAIRKACTSQMPGEL
jgi:hypothetical protein